MTARVPFSRWLLVAAVAAPAAAQRHPGLEHLLTGYYNSYEVEPARWDRLWTVWPEPLRARAEAADRAGRRRMAAERYGLPLWEERGSDVPLGFAESGDTWSLSCLACHGGAVDGRVIPGLGNARFAFRTLENDLLALRRAEGTEPNHGEKSLALLELGESDGTTNAQVFSAVLAAFRDEHMDLKGYRPFAMRNHDLDAPPLWNVRRKSRLYIDGYAPKDPRIVMQFALSPPIPGEAIRAAEGDFEQVLAWIESLEPPAYPGPVDADLAAEGRAVFELECARCHGTYGDEPSYPEKRVPLAEIGTDPWRLRAFDPELRAFLRDSWLGRYGALDVEQDPGGYVAPPLDGIWASAPYLHNGSVPTLWHLLRPDERPVVWRRGEGYDHEKLGLAIDVFDEVPEQDQSPTERKRRYFDTRLTGKSGAGHGFPSVLDEAEKRAVLEYLRTL